MDPLTVLSIAGNAAQFLSLALTVSSRIKAYCKSTTEIPQIFFELAIQIPLIADLCRKLERDTLVNSEGRLDDVLKGCIRTFETLNTILSKVTPESGDSVGSKVLKGLRSVSVEDKAKQCKAELESYKTTLTLYLSVQNSFSTRAVISPPPAYYHLPSLGQAKFIGRKDILQAIDRVLRVGGRDTNVAVLLGMGGQGKTSLAIEYCRAEKTRGYFKTILWINSFSNISIQRSFAEIARNTVALSGEQRVFPNSEAQITFIHGIIESKGAPWLVVFDNYDWPQKVKNILEYTPKSSHGAVIMTTRHGDVASLGALISVPGMCEADAVELLLQRTGHTRTVSHLTQTRAVVKVLGYLPLAIDQSAAYIRCRKITPGEFLDHYKNRKEKILKEVPSVWDYQRSLGEEDQETPLSVFTTWEMSFLQAQAHSPIGDSLGHFLSTLAFLAPLHVRMEIFEVYYERLCAAGDAVPPWIESFSDESSWDKYEYQDVVASLTDLSLVKHNENPTEEEDQLDETSSFCSLSLHPLVREWIQLRIPTRERQRHCIEALLILGHYINSAGVDYRNWPLKVRLQALSHVDASLELQPKYAGNWASTNYSELRNAFLTISSFYADNGRYGEAERVCRGVLKADKNRNGDQSQIRATELLLTDIYLLQGHYSEVEETTTRLMTAGDESNQETKVHMMKNLAKSFFKQGRYDEASSLYRDVLQQQASFLPDDHLDVLHTKENIAQVYRNQGQLLEAIGLYKTVLEAYQTAGLDNHLDALHCMVDLANTYRAQAKYDLATPLYEKASKEVSAKLHADHPTALSTKLFMAINLRELQRHEEAECAFQDVVERSSKVLGLLHPDTLKATMNYAILCDRTGMPVQAEELYRTTLDGREKKLGVDNPYTLRTVERLVSMLWNQDRHQEAMEITIRTLTAQRRNSLDEQLKAASLGSPVAEQTIPNSRLYRPVEILFENAAARDVEALDEAHRDRIETLKSLAAVYRSQGRTEEAEQLQMCAEAGEDILWQRLGRSLGQGHRLESSETLVHSAAAGVGASPLSYSDTINDPSPPYSEHSS